MEIRWHLHQRPEIQQISEFVLHTIQLDPDPLQVSKHFKRTHLQNIHTAEERGVKVEFGDQLEHLKDFLRSAIGNPQKTRRPVTTMEIFRIALEVHCKSRYGICSAGSQRKRIYCRNGVPRLGQNLDCEVCSLTRRLFQPAPQQPVVLGRHPMGM